MHALSAADYDFDLPPERIAQTPARPRDAARLLHVAGARFADHTVLDLPDLLRPGDMLVVNDTRVIPARLSARRGAARIEVLLNRNEGEGRWHALLRNAKRVRQGDTLEIEGAACRAAVLSREEGGGAILDFGPDPAALATALDAAGEVPLPPYLTRPDGPTEQDREDYQTLFAARPGAVAAPTASLHFTPRLIAALDARGVTRTTVTLHVGAGTFLPLREEDPRRHRIHAEWGEVTEDAAAQIEAARAQGGRIVAVGTTALRLIETAGATGSLQPFRGLTELYILPGFRFRAADLLMTNFHLPRSTLFMLVCAFAGDAAMQSAYAHAIASGYRFYSYGDSSLLERAA
jgi:S-adenosylmethionine:tRNA ribosyltransferase-isomerase